MGQPRIIEVSYSEFLAILRDATNAQKKIDATDKDRWNAFVRKHNIPEAGMVVKVKSGAMSDKIKAVIVEGRGKDDGYYVYSQDDRYCLKFDLGED